jgi:hypothetical protein
MTSQSPPLTLDEAQRLLRQFTCLDRLPPTESLPTYDQVRHALLQVREHSDYQIFGICADGLESASLALLTYLRALGYEDQPQLSAANVAAATGPVYVKYNAKNGRCHVDTYGGEHRGVLVSCQSAYDGDVNETFGHLPLDLFAA